MPTSRSNATRTDRPRAAVTLIELMVVMVIVATLLGLGLGAFRRVDSPDRLALMQVKDAMRTARLLAQGRGAPATVVIDAEQGEVYGLGLRAVGNWHFEDAEGTGWPVPALHEAAALVPGGVLGWALDLAAPATLVLDDLPPNFDSPEGVGLDLFVAAASDPRPMTILERPGSWAVGFDFHGDLEVALTLAPAPPATDAEEFRQAFPGVALPPGRWSRLTVVFDGRRLALAVDGRRAAEDTLFPRRRALLTAPGAPIRTGAGPTAYRGRLDELGLSSVAVSGRQPLPREVRLVGPSRALAIDARGHLDPAFHGAPEVVELVTGEPPVHVFVEYGLLGTVRSWGGRVTEARP